jgi:hypothetical protein
MGCGELTLSPFSSSLLTVLFALYGFWPPSLSHPAKRID